MHVRFTSAVGMEVVDEATMEVLGTISGILLHPDTAKVEGFFVSARRFLAAESLFLASADICRWGVRVTVRHADALGPVEDRVRLQTLLDDQRPVLGQPIVTQSGNALGKCADIQFDTLHFMIEWLFPRSVWKWGTPVPVAQVVEVRKDAVVVRDAVLPAEAAAAQGAMPLLERMPDAA